MTTTEAPPPLATPTTEIAELSKMDRGAIGSFFTGAPAKAEAPKQEPAKEAPKEEPPKEKVEPPKEQPKAEPAKIDPPKEAPKTKEDSISDLRKMRDEYKTGWDADKAALEALRKEYEEFKKHPVPKEIQERIASVEKEREQYLSELRSASLERDPVFRREYDEKINARGKEMAAALVSAGVPQAEVNAAMQSWNEDVFAEKMEEMSPSAKMRFAAAWQDSIRLYGERSEKIANANQEWQSREKAALEAQKQQAEEYQRGLFAERDTMLREKFDTDGLRGNTDLQTKVKAAVEETFNFQPRQFMELAANAKLMSEAVLMKDAELTEMRTKLEAQQKQLDEQKQFIEEAKSGIPRIGPGGDVKHPEDRTAIANSFLNPTFAGR